MTDPGHPVWGVVPVKSFETAKSRLVPVLSADDRRELARAMFAHVLEVLGASPALSGVLVVTDSADVAHAAERLGASAVRDPEAVTSLADCVDYALHELERRGATTAVVLLSDLPHVTQDDVAELVERSMRFDVVLAPDKDGDHTNALALRLGLGFHTSFGTANSLSRHRETAERAALSVSVFESPTVAFDVDTPEDYERLLASR
jgi:2-phospho-L-lactate guanylyltransferase